MANLCPYCFDNKGLQSRLVEIRPKYDEGFCDYHPTRKAIPVGAVAAIVDEVFRANYLIAGADWIPGDEEEPGYYGAQRGMSLAETLEELVLPTEPEILTDLVGQLLEDDFYLPQRGKMAFYDEDQCYERIEGDDGGHGALWETFCQSVTYEQRFLNPNAHELLGKIFQNIHLQKDVSQNYPVRVLKPEDNPPILRARVVTRHDRHKVIHDPEGELGPAPGRLGRSNRMNAAGIRAFYGAFDVQTCISELRPIVGSEIMFAEFYLMRDVVVLDTTRFSSAPKELNLFARDHVRRLSQWRFMQRFMTEIARPVSPDDEPFDYVATQVVAEYLNRVHTVRIGRKIRMIEGILYRSAQRPEGINIVLLADAARVEVRLKPPSIRSPSFGLGKLRSEPPTPPTLAMVTGSLRSAKVGAAEYAASPAAEPWTFKLRPGEELPQPPEDDLDGPSAVD